MKQETIEEVAEKLYPMVGNEYLWHIPIQRREGFIAGAKWQQEKMYTDGDMMFAYEQGARLALISQSPLALHKGEFPTPKEWFEKFKKK